jgi:hypothetical protein
LQSAVDTLASLWPIQHVKEKKIASVNPKLHDLWFKMQPQLTYLGHFYNFKEDPLELHKSDRLLNAIYFQLQDYEFGEESKRKQESIGKNIGVKMQTQQVTESFKCKFARATL